MTNFYLSVWITNFWTLFFGDNTFSKFSNTEVWKKTSIIYILAAERFDDSLFKNNSQDLI